MGKMNELSQVLDELIACSQGMIQAANALREYFSEQLDVEPVKDEPVKVEPAPVKFTFTDVRKAFSAKSYAGFTDQVKALITKYGAEKLSGVNEKDYPALMADLEAIE